MQSCVQTLAPSAKSKWSISEIMSGLGRNLLLGGKVTSEQSLARCNPREQVGKFIASELPRKGLRMLVAQVLVKCESHANGIQVGKVVRREHLALDHRKIDLNLVEPTGVNRSVDQDDARINFPQAVASRFAAMRRTVIHDPEQSFRRTVGLSRENLIHQSAKRFDAGRCFATPHDITTPNIPRRQILQCSATLVLKTKIRIRAKTTASELSQVLLSDAGILPESVWWLHFASRSAKMVENGMLERLDGPPEQQEM